jgi:hypothetical protein
LAIWPLNTTPFNEDKSALQCTGTKARVPVAFIREKFRESASVFYTVRDGEIMLCFLRFFAFKTEIPAKLLFAFPLCLQ